MVTLNAMAVIQEIQFTGNLAVHLYREDRAVQLL